MQRVSWADYAKGIGIILVVYGHVLRGINTSQMGLSEGFFNVSDKVVYGFHMPLFFFLSGLFAEKWLKRRALEGTVQKTKNLMYPYFVWSIIQGGIMVVLSSYTSSQSSLSSLAMTVYKPIEQFWFLYVLFLIFLIYRPLRKVLNTTALLVFSFVTYVSAQFFNVWLLDNVAIDLLFFSMGIYLMNNKINFKKVSILIPALIAFVAVNYLYITYTLDKPLLIVVQLLSAVLGITLISSISMFLADSNALSFLKYIGSLSMVIYLVHILAGSGFRIIVSKILHINSVPLHVIGGVIAGIVLPIVFYKITSYLKLNGILFGEFKKKSKRLSDSQSEVEKLA